MEGSPLNYVKEVAHTRKESQLAYWKWSHFQANKVSFKSA